MPVTFAEDATGEEAKADVTRVTPDEKDGSALIKSLLAGARRVLARVRARVGHGPVALCILLRQGSDPSATVGAPHGHLRGAVLHAHDALITFHANARAHLLTGTQAQARRGSSPVPHYWSLLLLLPGTEQGHAPRAVGVDAVVPHRLALHE